MWLLLNIHFHMLFLDGVYIERCEGSVRFRWVKAPTSAEVTHLTTPSRTASPWARGKGARCSPKAPTVGTLQTLPACDEPFDDPVGKVAGFSLHAGVAAKAHERKKLERLCRYISRPAVSEKRLSLTPNGNVRYQLKTPYRDGTTHVIFEPLDFIARLAALVPKPRVNLTRFHGVFAPNSKHRALVTPAKRDRGNKPKATDEGQEQTPAERRAWPRPASRPGSGLTFSMSWAHQSRPLEGTSQAGVH